MYRYTQGKEFCRRLRKFYIFKYSNVQQYQVGLYKLNSIDPELESAWFQPLNL
jgi:hypothetical protein